MWRALLANFHEIASHAIPRAGSAAAAASSIFPTRKQHNAVALALSDPSCSEHLLVARRHYCAMPWQRALAEMDGCALSPFLAGSLVLNEAGRGSWVSALSVLLRTMGREPWAMRENFVRRVALELPAPQMRLSLAQAFVAAERQRVAAEREVLGVEDGEQQDEGAARVAMMPRSATCLPSAATVLSDDFRSLLARQIAKSVRERQRPTAATAATAQPDAAEDQVPPLWRVTLEFLTEAPSDFPKMPSELSNYLVAATALGFWGRALAQVEQHAERAVLQHCAGAAGSNRERRSQRGRMKHADTEQRSQLIALQWVCAAYAEVPAQLRPQEPPPVVARLAARILTPSLFSAGASSSSSSDANNELAQTCGNLVLMLQRTCSWTGALRVLDDHVRRMPRTFAPTLLHYRAAVDSQSGWATCLRLQARMRSQLGPVNSAGWQRYTARYNTAFSRFRTQHDPAMLGDDVLAVHQHQCFLRVARAFERRRRGDGSGDDAAPAQCIKGLLQDAPPSVRTHRLFSALMRQSTAAAADISSSSSSLQSNPSPPV